MMLSLKRSVNLYVVGIFQNLKHIIQNFNFTPVSFMNQIEYVKCSKIKQSDLDKKSQEKWFILYLLCLQ